MDVYQEETNEIRHFTGLVIGLQIQIGQFLFNCTSSWFSECHLHCFLSYLGHLSSKCCCFGTNMNLSHRAVVAEHWCSEGAIENAAFDGACCSEGAISSAGLPTGQ